MNRIKERVKEMVEYAHKATDNFQNVSTNCDEMQLTYRLRDIYKAHGAAEILSRIYTEDDEIQQLWRSALDVYKLGNNFRDKFSKECQCKRLKHSR